MVACLFVVFLEFNSYFRFRMVALELFGGFEEACLFKFKSSSWTIIEEVFFSGNLWDIYWDIIGGIEDYGIEIDESISLLLKLGPRLEKWTSPIPCVFLRLS